MFRLIISVVVLSALYVSNTKCVPTSQLTPIMAHRDKLMNEFQQTKSQVSMAKSIHVVLGNVGSGKSTFVQIMAAELNSVRLQCVVKNNECYIEDGEFQISYGAETKTSVPKCFSNGSALYCDFPGFEDTDDPKYAVNAMQFAKELLQSTVEVKFVFVAGEKSVYSAGDRLAGFRTMVERSCNLIGDIDKFSNAILLVINGFENHVRLNAKESADRYLSDAEEIEIIAKQLTSLKAVELNKKSDSSANIIKFIDIVLGKSGKRKICLLHKPKPRTSSKKDESVPLSSDIRIKNDKQIIREAINVDIKFVATKNTNFGYAISSSAKTNINAIIKEFATNVRSPTPTENVSQVYQLLNSKKIIIVGSVIKLSNIIQYARRSKQFLVFAQKKFIIDVATSTIGKSMKMITISPVWEFVSNSKKVVKLFEDNTFPDFVPIGDFLNAAKFDFQLRDESVLPMSNLAIQFIDSFNRNIDASMKVGILWQSGIRNAPIDVTLLQNGKNCHYKSVSSLKSTYPLEVDSFLRLSNNFTQHYMDVWQHISEDVRHIGSFIQQTLDHFEEECLDIQMVREQFIYVNTSLMDIDDNNYDSFLKNINYIVGFVNKLSSNTKTRPEIDPKIDLFINDFHYYELLLSLEVPLPPITFQKEIEECKKYVANTLRWYEFLLEWYDDCVQAVCLGFDVKDYVALLNVQIHEFESKESKKSDDLLKVNVDIFNIKKSWKMMLKAMIHQYTEKLEVIMTGNTLSAYGHIVKMSDVLKKMGNHSIDGMNLRIFAMNSVSFDHDVYCRDAHITIIAPNWVGSNKHIDLGAKEAIGETDSIRRRSTAVDYFFGIAYKLTYEEKLKISINYGDHIGLDTSSGMTF